MQNEKTIEQLIRQREVNMPPEIMALIQSFDWKKSLRMIVTQNQIMIDVATDLEESVYLMLLGVVSSEEVYERLIESHEFSKDKAKKVLEEIDGNIFTPLFKQLSSLDQDEKPQSSVTKAQQPQSLDSRDAILAEIEKEEPVVVAKTSPMPVQVPEPVITINKVAEPIMEHKQESPITINKPVVESPGVTKPFSLNADRPIVAENIKLPPVQISQGIQADPISAGLSKTTITVPVAEKPVEKAPVRSAGAPDPYREPIE